MIRAACIGMGLAAYGVRHLFDDLGTYWILHLASSPGGAGRSGGGP